MLIRTVCIKGAFHAKKYSSKVYFPVLNIQLIKVKNAKIQLFLKVFFGVFFFKEGTAQWPM